MHPKSVKIGWIMLKQDVFLYISVGNILKHVIVS